MSYEHLRYEERMLLWAWKAEGHSGREIARRLERSPSTVSRELKRHGQADGYFPRLAQGRAQVRRYRQRCWPKLSQPQLWGYVQARLRERWSPQQIARRIRVEHPYDAAMRISHETIYTWLYVTPRGGLRRELLACLRQARPFRRRRRSPGTEDHRGRISGMVSIHARPPEVEGRQIPGHWEGDLIVGAGHRSCVGVLVERHSRYVHLAKMADATADAAYDGFVRSLNTLPPSLRQTLTYDQGKEMSRHADLSLDLQIQVYFADPHSPWQRGSCENTNGLLRQYLPKGTDLATYSQDDLDAIAFELNGRPRQTLHWQTPREVFTKCLQSTTVALGT